MDKKYFVKKPSEIDFLSKYSQAQSKEEKKQIEEEYNAEVDAYWAWVDSINRINLRVNP
jgi:abortive infection bacteriophage resistance protein